MRIRIGKSNHSMEDRTPNKKSQTRASVKATCSSEFMYPAFELSQELDDFLFNSYLTNEDFPELGEEYLTVVYSLREDELDWLQVIDENIKHSPLDVYHRSYDLKVR